MPISNSALATIERFKQQHVATTIPTSLAVFLYIYTHASYDCYIDHMAGAKALARYLAPIDIPVVSTIPVPDILVSYELQELAKVLKPHTTIPLSISINQIESAIYANLITKFR